MIAIVDYGLGNLQAIANIYTRLGIQVCNARTPEQLLSADRIILPGVGAFDWAMSRLNQSGMRSALEEIVIDNRRPVLGICVGMQMLANRSEEGSMSGLGWIPGIVKKFEEGAGADRTYLPHMGWNDVVPRDGDGIFNGLERDARFYFLHSFYFQPAEEKHILATTEYIGIYASGVRCENIYGVQFHPEKSHQWGIRLLKNFSEL